MSTTTVIDTRHDSAASLAVALGLVHPAPRPVRVPPLTQRIVPGRSPLEASGWAETVETDGPLARL
ncbi:hypothetical protein [Cellulomonas phragmiteti]|uniref:Uncharacterized protein n=1 Tax=Cellulomonas phragmiteti TaxID=478780 RepID=A0ABQ4DP65_9CELL|nr:hypothetical protein [Cellulomonas phragmiteti]GIG41124.1 hypothetical protein Cph01nite_28860 [Cellulomonas phragmiteti]